MLMCIWNFCSLFPVVCKSSRPSSKLQRGTVRYLIHKMATYSEYKPKLDYFPVDDKVHNYIDQDIPEIEKMIAKEIWDEEKIDDPEDAVCIDCGSFFQVNSIQNELKNFLKHQDVGTDSSYICVHCHDCIYCKRGVGHELLSMKQ